MSTAAGFVDHVKELLASAGPVVVKRMFGGHGVYLDGLFVAIIASDELYLKCDNLTRAAFDEEGCAPFTYSRNGKAATLGFRRAPGGAMDAPHLMLPWARLALEAALRAHAAKPAPQKKTAAKRESSRPATKKKRAR